MADNPLESEARINREQQSLDDFGDEEEYRADPMEETDE